MIWRRITILLLLLGLPGAACAGWTGYLHLDGVKGESQDTNHVNWIKVQDLAEGGVSHPVAANPPSEAELRLIKSVDLASPTLKLDCAEGKIIPSGTLALASATNSAAEFFQLNLTNVQVTSVAVTGAADGSSRPSEQLSLMARAVSWDYARYDSTNGLPAGYTWSLWNFTTSRGNIRNLAPVFVNTGIRRAGGVELDWKALPGAEYRVYAVTDLNRPFVPLAEITATNIGPMSYTFTPKTPAMFFLVERVPAAF